MSRIDHYANAFQRIIAVDYRWPANSNIQRAIVSVKCFISPIWHTKEHSKLHAAGNRIVGHAIYKPIVSGSIKRFRFCRSINMDSNRSSIYRNLKWIEIAGKTEIDISSCRKNVSSSILADDCHPAKSTSPTTPMNSETFGIFYPSIDIAVCNPSKSGFIQFDFVVFPYTFGYAHICASREKPFSVSI